MEGHRPRHDPGTSPVPRPPGSRPRRGVRAASGARRLSVEARLEESAPKPRGPFDRESAWGGIRRATRAARAVRPAMDDRGAAGPAPGGERPLLRCDVRGDPSRSVPDGADVLHRARQHRDRVGGLRGLSGHRAGAPRDRTTRRTDRHRPWRRPLRPAAHGPRTPATNRVWTSSRVVCTRKSGREGNRLLNDEEVELRGRTVAGVLRLSPERYGLEMAAQGGVALRDFLPPVQIRNRRFRFVRQHHVVGLIETDPKGRYQFEDGKIRATYGHSLDLDLDLPTEGIPDLLFYPTTAEESHILMEAGLRPSDRKMVHLSATFEAALEAGRVRIAQPVILEIDAKTARDAGVVIHKAGKTVFTSKEIPGEYLRRSTRVEEELPSEASADSPD